MNYTKYPQLYGLIKHYLFSAKHLLITPFFFFAVAYSSLYFTNFYSNNSLLMALIFFFHFHLKVIRHKVRTKYNFWKLEGFIHNIKSSNWKKKSSVVLSLVYSMSVHNRAKNVPDLFKLYMQLFINLAINPNVSLGKGSKK